MTIAFFATCGLDILNSIDILSDETKRNIIDWVYRHQVIPNGNGPVCGGFQGSSTLDIKNSSNDECGTFDYKWGHLAMTYTGIAILITLGDDLSRLDRKAIIEGNIVDGIILYVERHFFFVWHGTQFVSVCDEVRDNELRLTVQN